MNYLEFFELNQEPFSNAPVARFYYDSQQHGQALLRLRYAVEGMKGLAVLVGDIGAGKTTLARRLLDSLAEEEYEAALLMVVHAETTASWLLSRIALLLGVENPADDKLRLLSQLYQRLVAIHESGKKAVVLIDEAQMLRSRELMEEFRGLLNLELTEKKLLTFVFFGLTELDDNLHLDEPLNNRVALRVRLDPLSRTSTAAYVAHRLKLAGAKRPLLSEAAIDAVHRFSRGTPRLINTVCDNALLESFFLRQAQVDEAIVTRVAGDLGLAANALPPTVTAAVPVVAAPPRIEQPAQRTPPPAAPAAPAPRFTPAAAARPAPIAAPAPAPVAAPRPAPPVARAVPAPASVPVLDLGAEDELESVDPLDAIASSPLEDTVEIFGEGFLEEEPSPLPPPIARPAPVAAAPAPVSAPAPVAAASAEPEYPDATLADEVEIPQIDALDDIDSILDQLEDKG